MSQDVQKSNFFRQSGWMVLCTVVSGAAFFAVHPFSKWIPESEYAIFGLYLAALYCMSIPSVGLQMVFTQQTAACLNEKQERELASTARGVLAGIVSLWLIAVVLIAIFHQPIIARWKINNPAGLWVMLVVGLVLMCTPVFMGILQGRQNFLWIGWGLMLNSVVRLGAIAIIVLIFAGQSTGMSVSLLLGTAICLLIYAGFSQSTWRGPGERVNWKQWLKRVVPLTLGFGSFQFLFSVDPIFVEAWFDKNTHSYVAAGTLARALCTFTVPIVAVMFPRLVRSAALSEKTNVMKLTLLVTVAMAGLGALVLTLIAPWALTFFQRYLPQRRLAAPLVCPGHGAFGRGQRDAQQPDGAQSIQSRSLDRGHRRGLYDRAHAKSRLVYPSDSDAGGV